VNTARAGSELSLLRQSQDRVLEREGIPMVLALVSEADPVPAVSDAAVLEAGGALAARMDGYRDALVPNARDGDLGCLISVLQVVSYEDFGAPPDLLPEAARTVSRQEAGEEGGK
jgi:hypothetical protein